MHNSLPWLSLAIWLPIVFGVLILGAGRDRNADVVRTVALVGSLLGLLQTLNELMGAKIEPIFKPARTGDVRDSLADISLARSVLKYEPMIDLRTGLKPTIEFYRGAS